MLELVVKREQSDALDSLEQDEKQLTPRQIWYKNLPLNEKIKYRKKQLERYRKLSPEEKKRHHARSAAYLKNLPLEKKQEYRERAKQKYLEKTKEKRKTRLEKLVNRRKISAEMWRKINKREKRLSKILVQCDQIGFTPDIEHLLRGHGYHYKLKRKPKPKKMSKEERHDLALDKKLTDTLQKRYKQWGEAADLIDKISQTTFVNGSVRDVTLQIYDQMKTERIRVYNKPLATVIAACYYLACRRSGFLCRLIIISKVIGVNFRDVNTLINQLKEKLKIEYSPMNINELTMKTCQLMQLPKPIEADSLSFANRLSHFQYTMAWTPSSIIAVSIALTAFWKNFPLDHKELTHFTGISDQAFVIKCTQLKPHLVELISSRIKGETEIKEEIIDTA